MHAFLKTGKLGPGPSSEGFRKSKASTKEKKKGPTPWVEKYRPRSIEDVVYQDEVVSVLRKILKGADFPNLLFYGPPGTGKTSTILAAARELFGNIYTQRVMELNASDERGIQVIRDKVKTFAQTTVSSTKPNGQSCPAFKIIILDEADSMTSAAQAALRRTMEKQSRNTRFCLLCNYVSRIIDPLTSRCSKFRFKPLNQEVLLKHLSHICTEERVTYEDGALEVLIETCEGDLRRAITSLQSVARLKGESAITKQDIYEITGVVPEKWLMDLFEVSRSDNYEKLSEFVDTFILDGYSAVQLFNQIHDSTISNDTLTEEQKSNILERLAICEHRLCDGADEYLQIMDLCCTIMQEICHPNKA